jgi:type IV pilus assembly protein PilB
MVKSLKQRLTDLLIKSNLITRQDLKKAIKIQSEKGGRISQILVEEGAISEKDLMICLGQKLGIPPIDLSKYRIKPELVELIPERVVTHYQVIPVSKIRNVLTVAMADPLNVFALDDLKNITGCEIKPIITTAQDIKEAINSYYQQPAQMEEILEEAKEENIEVIKEEKETGDIAEITRDSKEAPIIKMVNLILTEGLRRRASDIHLEPYEDKLRVRYRIDGELVEAFNPPKAIENAIITRLKIMSKLVITERRLPQDGRFKVKLQNKEVDFRVSSLPISFGEKIVLRALDRSSLQIGLDELGFLPQPLKAFKEAVKQPYGMILITGPTGSGKSTTLYSILNQLNTPDKNIMTVEDPVEYRVEGISQLQVKPEIGLDFATGLKSILRQSPDVILVGEIRDFETADTAIKASLTGQLVFSTLHTNDACSATTRLIDMGVEPFLIASSLIMVGAQRLCRRICPNCKERCEIPQEVLDRVGLKLKPGEKGEFFRGKGCKMCNQTGYYGRMGTLEILTIDDHIRGMIVKRASADEIERYARSKGMKLLRENALEKFKLGMTTLEEVLRITTEE